MIARSESVDAQTGITTIEVWDTDTGLYTRTVDGVQVEERPLTSDEVAALEGVEAQQISEANAEQLEAEIEDNIDVLLATVDNLNAITDLSNATINQNPAAVIKDVAREAKTIARQTIRIARVLTGTTDTTDSGS